MSNINARRTAAERLRAAFAPELALMRRARAEKTDRGGEPVWPGRAVGDVAAGAPAPRCGGECRACAPALHWRRCSAGYRRACAASLACSLRCISERSPGL